MNSKPFSLLYLGTLPPHPGGTATFGAILLPGLARLGHRVTALSPIMEDKESEDGYARQHPELDIHRYPVPYYSTETSCGLTEPNYRAWESRQIEQRVGSLTSACRPDAILLGRESFLWVFPEQLPEPIPTLVVMHTLTVDIQDPRLLSHIRRQWRRMNGRIGVAEHLVKRLSQLGFDDMKIIPNGVDLERFRPAPKDPALLKELGIQEDEVVITHLSNLKPVKCAIDMVDSAAQALQVNPKLIYLIVGDGSCRQSLEEACRKKGLWSKFRFPGWIDYQQVHHYYHVSDLVVMPSELEAQAFVYFETQACGRVLLASDIAGAREVVRDGQTGLLFRCRDIGELTAKTLLAAADPDLRRRIGRAARRWMKGYDQSRLVRKYDGAIRDVIERAASPLPSSPEARSTG